MKRGDKFLDLQKNQIYILANSGHFQMTLINLKDGIRWEEPVKVKDVTKISDEEWEKITADNVDNFVELN